MESQSACFRGNPAQHCIDALCQSQTPQRKSCCCRSMSRALRLAVERICPKRSHISVGLQAMQCAVEGLPSATHRR
jgi:hypothetical protein